MTEPAGLGHPSAIRNPHSDFRNCSASSSACPSNQKEHVTRGSVTGRPQSRLGNGPAVGQPRVQTALSFASGNHDWWRDEGNLRRRRALKISSITSKTLSVTIIVTSQPRSLCIRVAVLWRSGIGLPVILAHFIVFSDETVFQQERARGLFRFVNLASSLLNCFHFRPDLSSVARGDDGDHGSQLS